jgi:hypothetical protein
LCQQAKDKQESLDQIKGNEKQVVKRFDNLEKRLTEKQRQLHHFEDMESTSQQ